MVMVCGADEGGLWPLDPLEGDPQSQWLELFDLHPSCVGQNCCRIPWKILEVMPLRIRVSAREGASSRPSGE